MSLNADSLVSIKSKRFESVFEVWFSDLTDKILEDKLVGVNKPNFGYLEQLEFVYYDHTRVNPRSDPFIQVPKDIQKCLKRLRNNTEHGIIYIAYSPDYIDKVSLSGILIHTLKHRKLVDYECNVSDTLNISQILLTETWQSKPIPDLVIAALSMTSRKTFSSKQNEP
jgi:hypothetical protein